MVDYLEFPNQMPHGWLHGILQLSHVRVSSWCHGRWRLEEKVTTTETLTLVSLFGDDNNWGGGLGELIARRKGSCAWGWFDNPVGRSGKLAALGL